LDLALQLFFFARKPRERGLRVRGQPPLALDVVAELNEPAVELGHAIGGARLFAVGRLARHRQSLSGGGGARLRLAPGGRRGRAPRAATGGGGRSTRGGRWPGRAAWGRRAAGAATARFWARAAWARAYWGAPRRR